MRTWTIGAAALLLSASGAAAPASADTAQATCEVRSDGKVKKDASGPCTFSQRQGYVDITLANDFTHNLTPGDAPNHYKDAKGHKVVRTVSGDEQTYKWDDRTIVVSFGAPASGQKDEVAGGPPADLKDLIGGKKVGGEVEDEMSARGWKLVKNSVEGDDVYTYYRKGKRCVSVHLDAARKVQSITSDYETECAK